MSKQERRAGSPSAPKHMNLKGLILSRRPLIERRDFSAVFGAEIGRRELTRKAWKDALAFRDAHAPDTDPDSELRTRALYAALFALGTFDPATNEPIVTPEEALSLLSDDAPRTVYDEIIAIGEQVYMLSEVGADALKSGDAAPDAG